jgi:hypothetical protein
MKNNLLELLNVSKRPFYIYSVLILTDENYFKEKYADTGV